MTPTKTRPHEPMLAEWTSEILSLSLSLFLDLADVAAHGSAHKRETRER